MRPDRPTGWLVDLEPSGRPLSFNCHSISITPHPSTLPSHSLTTHSLPLSTFSHVFTPLHKLLTSCRRQNFTWTSNTRAAVPPRNKNQLHECKGPGAGWAWQVGGTPGACDTLDKSCPELHVNITQHTRDTHLPNTAPPQHTPPPHPQHTPTGCSNLNCTTSDPRHPHEHRKKCNSPQRFPSTDDKSVRKCLTLHRLNWCDTWTRTTHLRQVREHPPNKR